MRKGTLTGIAIAAFMIAEPAAAIDVCFSSSCEVLVVVVKQYRTPARGKCRSVVAYEAASTIPYPATGTVCRSASGGSLYVTFTIQRSHGPIFNASFVTHFLTGTMPYPSLSGGEVFVHSINGTTVSSCGQSGGLSASACVPAPIP